MSAAIIESMLRDPPAMACGMQRKREAGDASAELNVPLCAIRIHMTGWSLALTSDTTAAGHGSAG